jgi:hemolysin-activating ACP:hemolysin acyltransferase
MKLQIKDSGAWRNMAAFTMHEQADVMQVAANLLRALQQPQTVMRVAEGDTPLFFCRAPSFLWSEA